MAKEHANYCSFLTRGVRHRDCTRCRADEKRCSECGRLDCGEYAPCEAES